MRERWQISYRPIISCRYLTDSTIICTLPSWKQSILGINHNQNKTGEPIRPVTTNQPHAPHICSAGQRDEWRKGAMELEDRQREKRGEGSTKTDNCWLPLPQFLVTTNPLSRLRIRNPYICSRSVHFSFVPSSSNRDTARDRRAATHRQIDNPLSILTAWGYPKAIPIMSASSLTSFDITVWHDIFNKLCHLVGGRAGNFKFWVIHWLARSGWAHSPFHPI